MKEARVDLFKILGKVDWACIPTNGQVRSGKAVMGRGVAELVKTRWPLVADALATQLQKNGNVPSHLGYVDTSLRWSLTGASWPGLRTTRLFSFPTKHHWKDPSDMGLILQSARLMMQEAKDLDIDIAIPRPGCGNGGLEWEDVRVDLKKVLDDRFTIITN